MLSFTANTLCKGIINKKYSKSTKHPKSSQTQSQTNYGAQLVPSWKTGKKDTCISKIAVKHS